jgi:Uncharacterized protein conserved in bacteria
VKKEFQAVIKQHENIDGAYVEPPFDVEEVFGAKRVKVLATFDGLVYRGSIVRMGGCYMLGLTKEIRKAIGKNIGDMVRVTVERDEEERAVEIPPDLLEAIEENQEAGSFFRKLSYTDQRKYVLWITDAKKEETRKNRIQRALQMLSNGEKIK